MENASSKIRILKLYEILSQETDAENKLSTSKLIKRLKEYGLSATRQTVYSDIEVLNKFGYEVICKKGTVNEYYVLDRKFNFPELRILIDAVQAASFISTNKTKELVDKIASLGGSSRDVLLKHDIVQFNTTKHTNEAIFYIVNEIEEAILNKKKLSFNYFDYDENIQKVYRRNGEKYLTCPIATIFSDDNYYLVAYSDKYDNLVHFRVDRMEHVTATCENFIINKKYDIVKHKSGLFNMFSGKNETVTIIFEKTLLDVIVDKFGENVKINQTIDNKLSVIVKIQNSPRFISWVLSFGSDMKVVAPKNVVKDIEDYIKNIYSNYIKDENK